VNGHGLLPTAFNSVSDRSVSSEFDAVVFLRQTVVYQARKLGAGFQKYDHAPSCALPQDR